MNRKVFGIGSTVPMIDKFREVPKVQYSLCSLERSGHTALMNWLAKSFSYSLNSYSVVQTHINTVLLYFQDDYLQFDPNVSVKVTDRPVGVKIYSVINRSRVYHPNCLKLILLRDPYNWVASIMKLERMGGPVAEMRFELSPEIVVNHYLEMAKAFYCLLDGAFPINYNFWFSSEPYRKSICATLGITKSGGLNDVPFYGGEGSSFDKTLLHGSAQKMKVLDRWVEFKEDEQFLNVFRKFPELIRISRDVFNFEPVLEKL